MKKTGYNHATHGGNVQGNVDHAFTTSVSKSEITGATLSNPSVFFLIKNIEFLNEIGVSCSGLV